jgi:hypothetical protein
LPYTPARYNIGDRRVLSSKITQLLFVEDKIISNPSLHRTDDHENFGD